MNTMGYVFFNADKALRISNKVFFKEDASSTELKLSFGKPFLKKDFPRICT